MLEWNMSYPNSMIPELCGIFEYLRVASKFTCIVKKNEFQKVYVLPSKIKYNYLCQNSS